MTRSMPPAETCKIVIVGGGRSGTAIARVFGADRAFSPLVLDIDYDRVRLLQAEGLNAAQVSGTDLDGMGQALKGAAAVICAAPPSVVPSTAKAARAAGCVYLDLCEDPKALRAVFEIAAGAETPFAPGCGLAPGLISLMVDDLVTRSGPEAEITAYVGVLPAKKINRLGYGNMWDIEALIAEYTQPCAALADGKVVGLAPLDNLETVTISGETFEAFTTSGTLDALVSHYEGRLKGLTFKTLRYHGHLDYISFLLDDLGLSKRLYLMRNLLLTGLERIEDDRVIVHLTCCVGAQERTQTRLFSPSSLSRQTPTSALAHISAYHVCSVADILVRGLAPRKGLLHHGDLSLEILSNSAFSKALFTNA